MAANNVIDFLAIAEGYRQLTAARNNQPGAAMRGIRVNEARLTNIKLVAENVTWNPPECDLQTVFESEVRTAQHSTERNMRDDASVRITHGLCRGLTNKLRMPYPGGVDQQHKLEIQPCNDELQSQSHPTPVTLASESDSGNQRPVQGSRQYQKYEGFFSSHVYPKGKILTQVIQNGEPIFGEAKTQYVIQTLKERDHPSVKYFSESSNGWYFVMRGKCTFQIDLQIKHEWQ